MSDKYVASTLSASVSYTGYRKGGGDLPIADQAVTIAGGANVADKRIITPLGVITKVTEDEAKFLEQHELFQLHKANGFVTILDDKPQEIENVVVDMTSKDESAPIVPQDSMDKPNGPQVVQNKKGR